VTVGDSEALAVLRILRPVPGRDHDGVSSLPVRQVEVAVDLLRRPGVSPEAQPTLYASVPVLYLITITLLRWLAPQGSEERPFT
jgi:hypothetical protein